MIYTKFEIKNFKGIKKASIDLKNNRIVTLVGLNESGKTTLMESIKLFYDMIKGDEPNETRLNELRPKGIDFTGSIEITGELLFEDEDFRKIQRYWREFHIGKPTPRKLIPPKFFRYTYSFKFNLHKFVETSRSCGFFARESGHKKSLHYTSNEAWNFLIGKIKEDLTPEILYYDSFTFVIPNKISFFKIGSTPASIDENNLRWQLVMDDVLKSVNAKMDFQTFVVDVWESDRDAASNRLAQMEKILNEKITSRWTTLFGKNNVHFNEIKLETEYNAGKFDISFKIRTKTNKEFLVSERSKGFMWFFSFLLFTEFRKKRTRNILFLLDEPASNLHSNAQAKILEALSELSKDSIVVYSTHSHFLVNPKWLPGTYVCINDRLTPETLEGNLNGEENSDIVAIKYFDYVGQGLGTDKVSYFQPILDRLDYVPSSLELVPNIVILEGKNDWYSLKYFSEIMSDEKFNFYFYPGGGAEKLWDIIRLYLSWGKDFLVLLDGDDGGIKAKQQYQQEFNGFIENRIFTLMDIFNKSFTLEDLISPNDKITLIKSVLGANEFEKIKDNGKKSKAALNYSINRLLMDKKQVGITESVFQFKKLLKFLKSKQK